MQHGAVRRKKVMSFFSWFTRKFSAKRPLPQPSTALHSSAASATATATGAPLGHASSTKNERMERRELLYIVVRDAMVCAGVLSASYKFKVLSLDPRGLQFLAMMDLAPELGGDTERLSEIEVLIAQTAKARYGITVSAVYWRINELVATGVAQKNAAMPAVRAPEPVRPATRVAPPAPSAPPAPPAPPARQVPSASPPRPAALQRSSAPPAPTRLAVPRFDPIEADEVAAFKQALATAAAARPGAATAGATPGVPQRSGARRPPSTSDFPDTVMPDQDSRAQSLSSTQYGEL